MFMLFETRGKIWDDKQKIPCVVQWSNSCNIYCLFCGKSGDMIGRQNRNQTRHMALSTFMGLPLSFGTNTNVSSFVNLHFGANRAGTMMLIVHKSICVECIDASLLCSLLAVATEANHTQHYSQ